RRIFRGMTENTPQRVEEERREREEARQQEQGRLDQVLARSGLPLQAGGVSEQLLHEHLVDQTLPLLEQREQEPAQRDAEERKQAGKVVAAQQRRSRIAA